MNLFHQGQQFIPPTRIASQRVVNFLFDEIEPLGSKLKIRISSDTFVVKIVRQLVSHLVFGCVSGQVELARFSVESGSFPNR